MSGNHGEGIDNRRAEKEGGDQNVPDLVEVTKVNIKGGQEQPGTENKPEVDEVNNGEQEHGGGQVPEQDE